MIEIWIDGSCEPINPGGTGCIGYIIKNNGATIAVGSQTVGKGEGMTNNVAEYYALIYALKEIRRLKLENEDVLVRSDSQLLVNQMNRKWKVHATHILRLVHEARNLAPLSRFRIEWISREENEEADQLARSAYKKSLKEGKVTIQESKKANHNLEFFLKKP